MLGRLHEFNVKLSENCSLICIMNYGKTRYFVQIEL